MSLDELKRLPQWVCAREDKIPLDIFGGKASPTNPATWDTYSNCRNTDFPYVGFVLSENDPFTIIDLDEPQTEEQRDRHRLIVERMDSYTETSASGKGLHIIVRGRVPKGVRRDKVEIYSAERYMICTGKAINEKEIEDRQELLDVLFREMDTTKKTELVQVDSDIPDELIVDMAGRAANGKKFLSLCRGEWEGVYPSQSEADLALLTIFAYYTKDNEQVRRLFRMSRLGKREKAQRDKYLDYALQKIRAKQPSNVDMARIKEALARQDSDKENEPEEPPREQEELDGEVVYPPGLVGEVAQYIEESSIRPLRTSGLAGALALCSGLWGRAFNISGQGLNTYLLYVGKTGVGKGDAKKGMDRILAEMRKTMPAVDKYIGPAGFASGQALLKTLDRQPCFVSVLGEFGVTLQQICSQRTNSSEKMFKKVVLDLYSQSGHGNILRPNVYADSEKNTQLIHAPAITLFGEGTPETVFEALEDTHIMEGLVSRFMLINHSGKRPPKNPAAFFAPAKSMVKDMVNITSRAMELEQGSKACVVHMDDKAQALHEAFDIEADDTINESSNGVLSELWGRADLKAIKLSALIAVGIDPYNPVITEDVAQWSINTIRQEVTQMTDHFASGEHNTADAIQERDFRRAFADYKGLRLDQRRSYGVPKQLLKKGDVVPFGYLRRRLRVLRSFKKDPRPLNRFLEEFLEGMCRCDVIMRVPEEQSLGEFDTRQALYVRGKQW